MIGQSDSNPEKRLKELFSDLENHSSKAIGYPTAREYDYSALYPFLSLSLNNCGDPFRDTTYKVQTHEFEREVVEFVADLHKAPKDNYWGYVTGGGTEGNMYGLYLGRQTFPEGVAYYSKAAHYSIKKNLDILRIESKEIDTLALDSMDYDDLRQKLDPTKPAIILATVGTTMMQARDDINKIQAILDDAGITERYIHCDAALDGMIAPFLDPKPAFDFEDGADSIAVSGHKFIGCPIPCGIVLCKRSNVEAISKFIPYINGYDETIPGSRNGVTPLFMWYTLNGLGKEGLRKRVMKCLKVASYAYARIQGAGIDVRKHENSLTLVLPKPDKSVVKKWQLATQGELAHILTVPGVEQFHIDEFLNDLVHGVTIDS